MQIWRNDNVYVGSDSSNSFLPLSIFTQMQVYPITCKYEEMIMFNVHVESDYQMGDRMGNGIEQN